MRFIASMIWALAAIPAMAQSPSLPSYDSDSYCRQVERRTGLEANSVAPSCLASERESFDDLRVLWPSVPEQVRGHCEQQVRGTTTGSYAALQGCLNTQEDAAATLSRPNGATP